MSSPDAFERASRGDSSAENERPPAVHVRFSRSQGPRLRRPEPDTCGDGSPLWTERPLLMQRADGTYELIGTSTNLDGLARWVLSFGTDATVLGPDQLRRWVVAEAQRVLEQYDRDAPDERPQ